MKKCKKRTVIHDVKDSLHFLLTSTAPVDVIRVNIKSIAMYNG